MSQPTLTFDTSCVISLLHLPEDTTSSVDLEALHQLQEWAISSKISIYISEKSNTEALKNLEKASTEDPENSIRLNKWLQTIRILGTYGKVTGRWILGFSRLGIDTVFSSDAESQIYDEMCQFIYGASPSNLKEGDVFDLAILFEHYVQGNELFVTRDKRSNILIRKAELQSRWNLAICEPIEAVSILSPRIYFEEGL